MTVALEEQKNHHEDFIDEQKADKGAISKPLAVIENWSVVQSVISQRFQAPEKGNRLRGYVPGCPDLSSTKLVHTSPIIRADLDLGLIETRNTIYRLGEASEEYKAAWSAGCL